MVFALLFNHHCVETIDENVQQRGWHGETEAEIRLFILFGSSTKYFAPLLPDEISPTLSPRTMMTAVSTRFAQPKVRFLRAEEVRGWRWR